MTITNFDQAYRTALALAATAPTKELAAECSSIAEEMELKLLLESINHPLRQESLKDILWNPKLTHSERVVKIKEQKDSPLSEADTMETMTINKEQEEAIIQAKVDRLTTQLVGELIEHLEKTSATEDIKIKCLGNKTLEELKEWLEENE